jgi:tol-pal system protein YbgF
MNARTGRAAGVGLVLLALALVPVPARAASKEMERLLIQMANLQSQLLEIQRMVGANALEIKKLSDGMGEQNASLRKAIQDQKMHEEAVQSALKEMSDRLADVTTATAAPAVGAPPSVMAGSEGPPGASSGTSATANASPTPVGAPPAKDLFSQAYADYARGNFDLSIQGFKEFLRLYPATDRSDNAQYWIGECLFGKGAYSEAVDAWAVLIRDFPSSDKIADARVKTGLALERLNKKKEALTLYKYVLEHYPNSEAAKIARAKVNPQ